LDSDWLTLLLDLCDWLIIVGSIGIVGLLVLYWQWQWCLMDPWTWYSDSWVIGTLLLIVLLLIIVQLLLLIVVIVIVTW